MKDEISWNDFEKIDIRVGTINEAHLFEKARKPAYQLHIDFGKEIGVKKSSAQITALYTTNELVGRQIIAIVNFPKKQIANFMSECLVLGVTGNDNEVVLLTTAKKCENGLPIG